MTFATAIGWVLMTLGAGLLAVAMFGVLRLPDTLARQHAGTKAATLALVVMSMGAGIVLARGDIWVRLGLLVAALWVTLPAASHALARAATRRRRHREESNAAD